MSIGRIIRAPVREVWKHEALDFTTWLERNIDVLNEHLDIPIVPESVRREQPAGAFSVDLIAEDEDGETVVIENQLERSDHDHLGKVLTYLAAYEASRAIWIVGDPRPEHVRAVAWLNDSSSASVWLFKLEAIRIGKSDPAPLLTRIVGPSEETRKIAATKREDSERDSARRAFFERLLDRAAEKTPLHIGLLPKKGPYLSRQVGGVGWVYGVREHGTRVIVWIERGAGREAETDAIFQSLVAHRAEIEADFGGALEWEAKESNRSRKIVVDLAEGGWADAEDWDQVIDSTVDTMIRLEAAVAQRLPAALESAEGVPTSIELDQL
ncbi:MAG: DUF4268 domain-containing protein [Acidimicrobiia bacterium]